MHLTCSTEQVQKKRPLVTLLHPHHLLSDILRSGANSAHCQEDIVLQKVPGQDLQNIYIFYDLCSIIINSTFKCILRNILPSFL